MLANLLPGVRELRAPLAAGYLWLLAVYLAFEPLVPRDIEGTLWDSLDRLREAISPAGVAVAVSFLAYVVGSLSETLTAARGRLTARLGGNRMRVGQGHLVGWRNGAFSTRNGLLTIWRGRSTPQGTEVYVREPAVVGAKGREALRGVIGSSVEALGEKLERHDLELADALAYAGRGLEQERTTLIDDLRDLEKRVEEREEYLGTPVGATAGYRDDDHQLRYLRNQRERQAARLKAHNEHGQTTLQQLKPLLPALEAADVLSEVFQPIRPESRSAEALAHVLEQQVQTELPLIRTRLLGREAEFFSAVDRLRAEAEFRLALGPPLLALAGALAWRATWWAAAFTVVTAVVLALQGVERARRSSDALIDAVRIGRAQAPALERVTETIERLNGAEAPPSRGAAAETLTPPDIQR
jgi:hypothetical protein